MLFTVPIDT